MSELHFKEQEQALSHLSLHPPGTWIVYEETEGWVARALTFQERREQEDYERDAVVVQIPTTVDLAVDDMRDEDWISLGKMVAELAAKARAQN